MSRLWIVLLFLIAACVEPSSPHAVGKWIHLRSDHFDLSTDMHEEEGRKAMDALEKNRAALLAAGWSDIGDRASSRLNIVILREHDDFTRYFGPNFAGMFVHSPVPTIYMWGPAQNWGRTGAAVYTLRHELTHRIAASIYARQPRWFSEGLAKFLEVLQIDEDWAKVQRGAMNTNALRSRHAGRHIHVADVLAWKNYEGLDQSTLWGLYGDSWLLVHWLYNVHPDEFASLQMAFIKGVDPDVAWKEVMGRWSNDQIDQELEHHARFGPFEVTEVSFTTKPYGVQVTPMTEADAYALDGRLWAAGHLGPESMVNARASIEKALALEPGNDLALASARSVGLRIGIEEWVKRVREQVQLRPNDGEAWLDLAVALNETKKDPAETEATFKKALSLLAGDATAYNDFAWFLHGEKRDAEALGYAIKAVTRDPSSPEVLDTHAAVLFALDRCPEALAQQRKALDRIGDKTSMEHELRERLATYEAACH